MRGSTAALMAAALLMLLLLPVLLMLLVSSEEQETRRMFVEWKAKYRKTYKYAGKEECRYALFKDTRRRVARANAAGVTSSGLNGLSSHASEEIFVGYGADPGWRRDRMRRRPAGSSWGWKAKYGKIYRDVGGGRPLLESGSR
ncbi:hypothetical protein C2845_PM17G00960 [Panicum miliaceum]|uniref:Cathepsin propeptide inhibitor domain-containing protein n=1 Tax=Panicum miliaceum TaxID=4540 RepID=A0A3L6Q0M9_PANMI|nr:hypothetical protein C2845_PM17G00960 [Panicum miliaceum]